MNSDNLTGIEVAVIGMAARFPGAKDTVEFWNNLVNGVESISFFSDQELIESGLEPALLDRPGFVRTFGGPLEDKECFDAAFFGYTPSEAEVMAPQMRVFHECSWEALEDAGYEPETYKGLIGIYAGASTTSYWEALCSLSGKTAPLGDIVELTLCNKDQMTCRISYNFNLKGPCFTFNTKCSTSLVAIHLACQGILSGECDMALAGAVTINFKRIGGYIYQQGDIMSPDGHLRSFDAKSRGLVWSEGVGLVVLKSLEDALADRDHIYAVVKGSAINNDGNRKVGYTAPSVESQVDLIRAAQCLAEVEPESISYLEAHGSGTVMGDPIEIKALKRAFNTEKKGFCRLGSVKSNIGHMVEAAGVGAFIKTALALKHKLIPPSLHFESANPEIDFENSPFIVNDRLQEWNNNGYPLRAGVSSFGIGGSNAHVILEEAPLSGEAAPGRAWQLLSLSARTPTALDQLSSNVAAYLEENPDLPLADAAYTLQVGRKHLEQRKILVCADSSEAARLLSTPDSGAVRTASAREKDRSMVFVFSGLGGQYVNMGLDLYRTEPVFRQELDRCFEILAPLTDFDLKELLYPAGGSQQDQDLQESNRDEHRSASNPIDQTRIAQPVIFIFEYALAKLLMQWGITPQAMIGYSFGEYTAACLAGVFSLEEALRLVIARGKLIQSLPAGLMLSVPLDKDGLSPLLKEEISLAIDNGPSCIVAGTVQAIENFEQQMKQKKYLCMRLPASHALHSRMMEPILQKYQEEVGKISLNTPAIPYISNVTGTWINAEDATDPGYWANHLSHTVRFAEGMQELLRESASLLVELGPGRDISTLISRYLEDLPQHRAVNLIRPAGKKVSDSYYFLNKIGHLWLHGTKIDWPAFYSGEKRSRLPLPRYPFERLRRWFGNDDADITKEILNRKLKPSKKPTLEEWFYIPIWKRSGALSLEAGKTTAASHWVVFNREGSLGSQLTDRLAQENIDVTYVSQAKTFNRLAQDHYAMNPGDESHYDELFRTLKSENRLPGQIVHLWSLDSQEDRELTTLVPENLQHLGYHSLIAIAQTAERLDIDKEMQIAVISNRMHDVLGGENSFPAQSTLLGAVKVIPLEYPRFRCQSIDVELPPPGSLPEKKMVEQLYREFLAGPGEKIVAYRNNHRWLQTHEPYPMKKTGQTPSRLREKGVYLVTGGLSGIGLLLAEYLAKHVHARLILLGRSPFPPREGWNQWIAGHGEEDPTSTKIRKLEEFENWGAEVLILSADVADRQSMENALTRGIERFGTLNGVIHSAGLADGALIVRRNREMSDKIFAAKLRGTLILNHLLEGRELDFFILCSSLTAVTGGIGQAGYCAANSFLDAFAHWKVQKDDTYTVSIDWDRWKNVGIATIAEEYHEKLTGQEMAGGVTAEEGIEAFSRILEYLQPQVAVSSYDLDALQRDIGEPGELSFRDAAGEIAFAGQQHPRPELSTPYLAPRNRVERDIAMIWQKLFGFERVGIQDDFLELGGDSLKAITVISRVNKQLDKEVPLAEFFKNPTIEFMSRFISGSETRVFAPVLPAEKKEYYALSSAQKRLYVLQQMDQESISYNEDVILILQGNADKEKLESVFTKLLQRHECLRTSIEFVENEPVQVVHPGVDFSIACFQAEENQVEDRLNDFIQPFDMSKAPLLRVGLVKIAETRHLFIIDIHHIITDGISSEILITDLLGLYGESRLPGLLLQYRDYAEWQNSRKEKGRLQVREEYWLKVLEGEIPILDLAADYPRPPMQSFEGHSLEIELPAGQVTALKKMAREQDATLYMILLAIYNVLLSKLSGQEDIIVGTPVAGRSHADLMPIMGLFVNTLALRNFPAGHQSFTGFLGQVKENALLAFENQDYPFEDLIDRLELSRDMSRNPLFDTMFMLQNRDIKAMDVERAMGELKVLAYKHEDRTSKFDLSLEALQSGDHITLNLEYCTKLFKPETARRFAGNLRQILARILENPEQPISGLDIVSDAQKNQILYEFNDTNGDYPHDKTIHGLFEEQAEKTPDHTAVTVANRKLTYRELNRKAGQLSGILESHRLRAGELVGIKTQRSLEMIIGLFAILKAGGAYLPIDPGYPGERIYYMLADSGARILLSTGASPRENAKLKRWEKEHVSLDLGKELACGEPGPESVDRRPGANSASLAYVIYTSGSTGKPKGVLIEHRSVVNRLNWMQRAYPLDRQDVILQKTTIVFDVSVWELFWWSWQGASLCLLGAGEEKNPAAIVDAIARHNVTTMHFVPSMLSAFLEYLQESPPRTVETLAPLRQVFSSGEALLLHQADTFYRLLQNNSGTRLINLYGPTEATVDVSYFNCSAGDLLERVPIGKPIANIKLFVFSSQLHLQPVGLVGELHISGAGLARGYLNRPELTGEKFIDFPPLIPHSPEDSPVYKTGDLARWLPDGNLEFLGRMDNQVKIRGFRIETEEIQKRLLEHDEIKEAIVIPQGKDDKETYLTAYMVSQREFEVAELRDYLARELPDYMLPSYFVRLDHIPLTANGKINRKALPEPTSNIKTGVQYLAPENEAEKTIARIWADILKVEKVGINDNFFELGGTSLDILRLNNRFKAVFGKDIPVVTMFRYSTVSSFARSLEEDNTRLRDRSDTLDRGKRDKKQILQKRKNMKGE